MTSFQKAIGTVRSLMSQFQTLQHLDSVINEAERAQKVLESFETQETRHKSKIEELQGQRAELDQELATMQRSFQDTREKLGMEEAELQEKCRAARRELEEVTSTVGTALEARQRSADERLEQTKKLVELEQGKLARFTKEVSKLRAKLGAE